MKIAPILALALAIMPGRSVRLQPDPPAKPQAVVDNGEFMDLFLKTTYGELQEAMAKPPADRKAWATIYQRAIRLAEMQNLLFFRDRDEVNDPRWGALTAASRQASADVANAALFALRNLQKADYEGVRKKYTALVDACNACHKTFARDAPTIKP
jgi:cytochrome c556